MSVVQIRGDAIWLERVIRGSDIPMSLATPARSLLLTAPRTLAWVEEALAPPQGDEVLVRTRAGAISGGSELPQYLGAARGGAPPRYPRMTGYESVGTVAACGPQVRRLHVGDRVVTFYGHRTAALVPERSAIPVPDGISDELALLAILTCDAAKGVRAIAPLPEESALITGAGAMGLFTLFILKAYGVAVVDVVEPAVSRHALALALGARATLTPDEAQVHLAEYAIAFECSSRDAAFALAQERLLPGGRLCVLADGNLEPLILTPAFHQKELRVVASSDGWDYQTHAAWYFTLLQRHLTPLDEVFQQTITSNELSETFARLASRELAPVKVLVAYRA